MPTAPYSKDWFDKLPEEVQKRYPKTRIIIKGKKGIGLKEDIEGGDIEGGDIEGEDIEGGDIEGEEF